MPRNTPHRVSGNVVALRGRSSSASRSIAEIRADILPLTEALKVLMAELLLAETGQPAAPVAQLVSLKEAARQTGWEVRTIKAHIVRRATHHPELPQLGFQPGNVANSPWFVNIDLLIEYIQGRDRLRK